MFRPPYTPVAIGALAGHHRGKDYRPTRLTPSHDWAREQGAVFVETGMWLRAQYFPRGGESDWLATVSREVTTVRSAVGVCDVSTLGKIDIQGADAAEFLERVYCNAWKSLAVGRARYGLMLREDGIVMDDGTTSRLGERHFLMTTTTANAGEDHAAPGILPPGAVAASSTCRWSRSPSNGRSSRLPVPGRATFLRASSIASTTFPTRRSHISRRVT